MRSAFTLIELLIVVAIIAILAAIAVPNFLEAQVRSKVSRVKTDLRTLATTIESYQLDYNAVPFDGAAGAPKWGWIQVWSQCTTPVAYMTAIPIDVFQDTDRAHFEPLPAGHTCFVGNRHSYDVASSLRSSANYGFTVEWLEHFGASPWAVGSCGPDSTFWHDLGKFGWGVAYDATNGTMSQGDIYRSSAKN